MIPFPELLPIGTMVDNRFTITGELGSGGFGRVYRAVESSTGGEVALKIPFHRDQKELESLAERMRLEAAAAARIRHPNVVQIQSFSYQIKLRLPGGFGGEYPRAWMLMELLDGHTLAAELKKDGPLSGERAYRLFSACLSGLAKVHQCGVIHKDLKPDNLFIVEPGSPSEVLKIIDFGIVRAADEQKLTRTGRPVCTPQYAAPEYLADLPFNTSVDVYQMGLILAEMLTGQPVVEASHTIACCEAHIKGVSLSPLLTTSPWGGLLQRAIARDPKHRYPDAAAFCDALKELDEATVRGRLRPASPAVLSPPPGHRH